MGTGYLSEAPNDKEKKTQYWFMRIILVETVILNRNMGYFVRVAWDYEKFKVHTPIFVVHKDNLATIDERVANAIVSKYNREHTNEVVQRTD